MNNKKELIVFDLDGTLNESKLPIDKEMATLFPKLLKKYKVSVTSGKGFDLFQNQFLKFLKCDKELFNNLFLFPTCSTSFYIFKENWLPVYKEILTKEQKEKIFSAFKTTFKEMNYQHPEKTYGDVIEDRETQVTFSAFGQLAPLELKQNWDPDQKKRIQIKNILEKYLQEFEVRVAGTTSIDITKKGITKAYGIRQIEKNLKIPISKMLFVGDDLTSKDGNDYPVRETGIEWIEVEGPKETKEIIRKLLD